jgi:hypothetical protein
MPLSRGLMAVRGGAVGIHGGSGGSGNTPSTSPSQGNNGGIGTNAATELWWLEVEVGQAL